jgi:hypothetical protein
MSVEPREPRFAVQQHEDGQVYITEGAAQMHHVQINGPQDVEVQVGTDGKVAIDKLYGPLIFWGIRVSCDVQTCEWVIEREMGPQGEWKEWTRIPGQLDEDFSQ